MIWRLPDEALQQPYPTNTLVGLALDLGHDPTSPYGDDGVLQFACRRCYARFWGTPKGVQERGVIDGVCELWKGK